MIEKYIQNLPYGINLNDILAILILILFICNIILYIKNNRLKNKINLIPGLQINQKVLLDIEEINKKLNFFDQKHKEKDFKIKILENRTKDIQEIKTLKYNPYKDMGVGGNQSFSTGIIDKNGNGIIITNLYSRERTRVLLKEIDNFQTKQELTPEENEVLNLFKKEN